MAWLLYEANVDSLVNINWIETPDLTQLKVIKEKIAFDILAGSVNEKST